MKLNAEGAEFAAGLDGGITVNVRDALGNLHEVAIPAHIVDETMVLFQRAQFAVLETGSHFFPTMPVLEVDRVQLALRDTESALMVSIVRIGWTILNLSDETLRKLRSEIDRLLVARSGPKSKN